MITSAELSSLPTIDYADRFSRGTDAEVSPERWARALFGDVPSAGELFIWQLLLGLRLSRGRSPETVAGWRVGARGEDWIRLEAPSWFLAANLLVQTAPGRVSLSTFVHYGRWPASAVWPPLSGIHRRLVPGVLDGAVARVNRRWPVQR